MSKLRKFFFPLILIKFKFYLSFNLPVLQKNNFACFFDEVQSVGRKQDGPFSLEEDLHDSDVEDVVGQVGVDGRERRIEESAAGLRVEGARDGKTLTLPSC